MNDQIKFVIPNGNGKIINLKLEKQLTSLIHQHNQLAIEVTEFNIMFRKSAAGFFVGLSFLKIASLYLMIYMKEIFSKILIFNVFVSFFFFGFGMTLSFSLQIKSAKQSFKLIHSIFSKHRMRCKIVILILDLQFCLIFF